MSIDSEQRAADRTVPLLDVNPHALGGEGLGSKRLQIGLLVLLVAFVGGVVGLERSILPLVAQRDFGIASFSAAVAFISTFGVSKALTNLFSGALSDRIGRRACLLVGWVIGLPVPILIVTAHDWWIVLVANVFLGVNQALTWSMTINMKLDLVEKNRRGLVTGLNEFAGYSGVALLAFATATLAEIYDWRVVLLVGGISLVTVGLLLSLFVRDTTALARHRAVMTEAQQSAGHTGHIRDRSFAQVFQLGTWKDSNLSAASFTGLLTNLKDGLLWGILPLFLASRQLSVGEIGLVVACYPAVWGLSQLLFGPLSDYVGRRALISTGLLLQGAGVVSFLIFQGFGGYMVAAVITGLGTAMAYPTLQAFVSDVSAVQWRASALGVYRFWRDLGYAIGALGAGLAADAWGVDSPLLGFGLLAAVGAAFFTWRVGLHSRKQFRTNLGQRY
jgi:MFS family permease